MSKQEMVVYEMVRDKKIPKILKIENETIAICRSGYFGRKDFAIFRDSSYPYVMKAVDTESREHVFWVDKDTDVEELMRCCGKGW